MSRIFTVLLLQRNLVRRSHVLKLCRISKFWQLHAISIPGASCSNLLWSTVSFISFAQEKKNRGYVPI